MIGGGIIGLEMATVYSTLGARIDVVEMLDGMMPGADRDLVKVWEKMNAQRFDNVMLKTKTVSAEGDGAGIEVGFEGEKAPSEPQTYDLVLVAVGRSPNGKAIDAEKAGVAVTDRGFIPSTSRCAPTSRTSSRSATSSASRCSRTRRCTKAHVAAEAAAGQQSYFDARQIPSVAYTDPEVAWAGLTEDDCKEQGIKFGKAVFPWAASRPRDRQRPRRRLHQAPLRRGDASLHRRRHRRHARRRPDRRNVPRGRDGLRPGRHRQDDPSASDAFRVDRHGRRSVRGRVHRPAAGEEEMSPLRSQRNFARCPRRGRSQFLGAALRN